MEGEVAGRVYGGGRGTTVTGGTTGGRISRGEGREWVEVYWVLRDVGAHFHGEEVGSVSLGTSFVDQRRYILLEVEHRNGEIEVGNLDRLRE